MPDDRRPNLQETVLEVIENGGKVLVIGDMPHKNHCPKTKLVEFMDSKKLLATSTMPKVDLIIRLKTMPHKVDFKIDDAKQEGVIIFPELVTSNEIRRTLKSIESKSVA